MKRKLLLICAGTLLTTTVVNQALAVTSSGTIGATLTLTNGCQINGYDAVERCQRRKHLYRPVYDRQLYGRDNRQYPFHRPWLRGGVAGDA